MKKIFCILLLILTCLFTGCGNQDMQDTVYIYDYAYILLPNGEVIEGDVDKWSDYEGDQLQITIEGNVYLTDTTRAVLIQYE